MKKVAFAFGFVCAAMVLPGVSRHAAAADLPPVAAYAALPAISDGSISPSGRYVVLVATARGRRQALILDRSAPGEAPRAIATDPDADFQLQWCRFSSERRIVCGFHAAARAMDLAYTATRLAAMDVDGKNPMALMRDTDFAGMQFLDRVISWKTDQPDTILIEAEESLLDARAKAVDRGSGGVYGRTSSWGAPALFELNVATGKLRVREHHREPLKHYVADPRGEVRLAWGYQSGTSMTLYARRDAGGRWAQLGKYDVFARDKRLHPIAIDPDDGDRAFALGSHEGRKALWSIDLLDREPPKLIFDHPTVDVHAPVFSKDGRIIGVLYETDTPYVFYTDRRAAAVADLVRRSLGNRVVHILDASTDRNVYLLESRSDIDGGTYYVLDVPTGRLAALGTAYPGLKPEQLGRMTPISYAARDGTRIPGYLTTPPGRRAEKLPTVVLPHGGPTARDSWDFDFLLQFLVSRGYAVLQMNFRGSAGYGDEWLSVAHQDWGGITYDDIVDGMRWAVNEGIADPSRICMVGWSFGGYAALLAATREGTSLRCVASIAGVSDLSRFLVEQQRYGGVDIVREQVGTDRTRLAAASPRRHVEDVKVPILLVHGDHDDRVDVQQSKDMAAALQRVGRPHELLLLPGADHSLSSEAQRTLLLTALERFLAANLGSTAAR